MVQYISIRVRHGTIQGVSNIAGQNHDAQYSMLTNTTKQKEAGHTGTGKNQYSTKMQN
jgi:hypothetical protein